MVGPLRADPFGRAEESHWLFDMTRNELLVASKTKLL